MHILRKDSKPLFQELHNLFRHHIQVMYKLVPVDIAEPRAHRIIDEQHITKLIPAALVIPQRSVILNTVRTYLHQSTIHAAAARPTVEPDDRTLAIRNVPVLKEPEEEVAVVFGCDFDVAGVHLEERRGGAGEGMDEVVRGCFLCRFLRLGVWNA